LSTYCVIINKDKVVAMVTDGQSSQICSNKLLAIPYIHCSAHRIQLAIKDAMESCSNITEVLQKAKRIIKHFKKSYLANDILHKVITINLLL
jgi:hypothetical protein